MSRWVALELRYDASSWQTLLIIQHIYSALNITGHANLTTSTFKHLPLPEDFLWQWEPSESVQELPPPSLQVTLNQWLWEVGR